MERLELLRIFQLLQRMDCIYSFRLTEVLLSVVLVVWRVSWWGRWCGSWMGFS